jgi:hypothetical protein
MNTTIKNLMLPALLAIVFLGVISCEKEPGVGGNSILYGKVFVKDYNSTFTVLQETYYGPEIWVYIIYGEDKSYSDRIQTGYDGTYEFKYLRPGNYQLYVYSKDSTLQTNAPVAVIQDAEITGKNEEVELPDFVIFN